MDTMLGDQDYALYEAGNNILGDGFQGYVKETVLDSSDGKTVIPADYFARNRLSESTIAAFGVNSTLKTEKPYKMICAHWANLASSIFDYTPDTTLNFTNNLNEWKTADSAVALYFDLGTLGGGEKKTFSTYYGVTANVKNKGNQVRVNTTAPSVLRFNDARTDFIGSSGEADNLVRVSTTVNNPSKQTDGQAGTTWSHLRVAVYAVGLTTQRQSDDGSWTTYDNTNPLVTEIEDFKPGRSLPTYFDFQFTPQEEPQLGSFVTKVYNFDPAVNELGVYAEDFCIATTENSIFIPGKDPDMPVVSVLGVQPEILYNEGGRYLTIAGKGMSFLKHAGFRGLELVKEEDETVRYAVATDACSVSEDGNSAVFYLEEYMETGRYQVHMKWDSAEANRPEGVPEDITGDGMKVLMTDDESYRNDLYAVLAVVRKPENKYSLTAFRSEAELSRYEEQLSVDGKGKDLLLTLRGDLVKEEDGRYRMAGQDKSVTISNTLKYTGSSFEVQETGGSVRISMNGSLTTLGANTSVRNGRSSINLESGKEIVVPVYNQSGVILSGNDLTVGQEYMEVSWDSSYSFLQSVGGFLIDLRYGVFGKMNDTEEDQEDVTADYYDIVSFGGGLDLSFMTPGGAQKARENQSKSSSWTYTKMDSTSGLDPYGFESFVAEDAPEQEDVTALAGGAQITDVLFGSNGKKDGYIGINMDAWMTMPQIVSFLPGSMSGQLSVNTIGGYEVGVEGEAEAANFEMQFALVVKGNPSGAPIPDKLYFTLGGFEPGANVDGLGIFWLTGGGGGYDKLYDTIYGTDGLPPLTLLLNVQFDIFKVMTGTADLELSLRAIAVSLSDVSLKFVRNARFLDGGSVGVAWYPNMEISLEGSVNFMQLFKGSFYVIGTQDLFEMMMRVAISLPQYIPVIGGMEIASAELGGGTVKMWGSVTVLGIIHLGFVYYWDNGEVKFTTSRMANARQVYRRLSEPIPVQYNAKTDETQMMYLGTNLNFVESNTTIYQHRLKLDSGKTYLITVNAVENGETLKADDLTLTQNGSENLLKFYEPTGDVEKDQELTQSSNANLVNGVAYIAVKGSDQSYLLSAGTDAHPIATSVGVIEVEELPTVENVEAETLPGGSMIKVKWKASHITDDTKIHFSLSEKQDLESTLASGNVLLNQTITSKSAIEAGFTNVSIPDDIPSGNYYVNVTVEEEGKTYERVQSSEKVMITNPKAPEAPDAVTLKNQGNYKLTVDIQDNFQDPMLDGYYIDVYETAEDGTRTLKESGLYFTKEQAKNDEVFIGGRYEMPGYAKGEDGTLVPDGTTTEIGYTPGCTYDVDVRAGRTDVDAASGEETLYCSSRKASQAAVLNTPKMAELTIAVNGSTVSEESEADGVSGILSSQTSNTVRITSTIPVKGTLTVDGAEGESYPFTTLATEFSRQISLSDGVHTLEFACENEQGDQKILTQNVIVDTTPPLLLLESPTTGETPEGSKLQIRAAAEKGSRYTFLIDGEQIGKADQNLDSHLSQGQLRVELILPENQTLWNRTLTILAKDHAGNETKKEVSFQNGALLERLADLKYVELLADGSPVKDGVIDLTEKDHAELKLTGVLSDGSTLDLTGYEQTSVDVRWGDSVKVETSGETLVKKTGNEGDSQIMAVFRLLKSSDLAYVTAVSVRTTAQESPEDPSNPDTPTPPDTPTTPEKPSGSRKTSGSGSKLASGSETSPASPIGDLALGEIPTGKMSEPGKDLAEIDLGDDTGEVNTPVEEIQEKEDKDGIPKPDQEEDAVDADSQSVENGHLSWILLILLIVTAGIGFLLILLGRRKREE